MEANNRIAFLDYLRIFAFVSVLAGHKFYPQMEAFAADEAVHATPRLVVQALLPLCFGGGAGVVVFFLVSGYIIAHVLQAERAGEFAVKRIFRIYPLFIAAVLIEHATTAPADALSVRDWAFRFLLLGDFAGVPYALAGVEWTLRVEIVFYVYMGLLRWAGVLHRHREWLPLVLTGSVLGLGLVAPFPPGDGGLSRGYLTIYGPFLLLGVAFHSKEIGAVGGASLLALVLLVFCQHFVLIGKYQSYWLGAHFAGLSFVLFACCWAFRRHVVATPLVLFVSELTYAVYLFHNWAFEPIRDRFAVVGVTLIRPEITGLIGLFAVCAIANRCVEKPAARFGRLLAKPGRGAVRLTVRRFPVASLRAT